MVRGGIEPPASAVSERRSHRLSYRTVGTPCGTRTRSPAVKEQETNPYPNGAFNLLVPPARIELAASRASLGCSTR